jgi:Universal stress protein UspA and related nucleotide-binding proteins
MYKNILLAIDVAHLDSQTKAVKTAVDMAKAFGATIHVLTVVPDFGMSIVSGFFPKDHVRRAMEEANTALHAYTKENIPAEVRHRHIVDHGTIYEVILRYARELNIDLIVISAARPKIDDYFLGPNAARVVRHADATVVVVRETAIEAAKQAGKQR